MSQEQKEAYMFTQSLNIQKQEDSQRYKNIVQIYTNTEEMHPSYAESAFKIFVENEFPSENLNRQIVELATPMTRAIIELNKNPKKYKQFNAEMTSETSIAQQRR